VSERLGESSSIALLDGDDILYVARSSITRRIMSVDLSIGTRLPAYCTSMGRVLLASLSLQELAAHFKRVKLVAHTPRTLIAPERIRKALVAAAEDGYAIVDQELELGLRSLAVPVRRHDRMVVAAVNVGVHAGRVEPKTLVREYLPVLQDAALEIGQAIGHAIR